MKLLKTLKFTQGLLLILIFFAFNVSCSDDAKSPDVPTEPGGLNPDPIEPGGKNPDPTDPGGKNPGGTNPDPTDTVPPAGVSGATFGDLNVIVWANPTDADFSGVLILRNTSSIADTPSAGTEYTVGGDIGGSEVVQSANSSDFGVSATTVNTAYYYKIFAYDASHNYAAGVEISATRSSDKIIFVNATASGPSGTDDGTSWSNAYSDLRSVLKPPAEGVVATTGDKIVVAKGIYKPTSTTSDRDATFQLISGVKVYGGFDVADTSLSERNWRVNKTILSGDIVGDDTDSNQDGIIENADDIKDDNVYTVVTGASNTTLEGFTITAGQSNGSALGITDAGGGYHSGGSDNLILSNIIFSGNEANAGGGMYSKGSMNMTLSNVIFSGNTATGSHFGGGGIYDIDGSNLILRNVIFSRNKSNFIGGGMYVNSMNIILNNVIFSKNTATNIAGGFFVVDGISTLINVIMWGNTGAPCTAGASPRGNQNICSRKLFGGTRMINISHSLIQGCGVSDSTWVTGASSCGDDNDGDDSTGNDGDGGNNIDADPMFDDDLRLMMGSPAIDAGSNNNPVYDASSSTPPTNMEFLFGTDALGTGALDLAGRARIVGSSIDMGAYESQ